VVSAVAATPASAKAQPRARVQTIFPTAGRFLVDKIPSAQRRTRTRA
jgi:hypothetical protein